MSRLTDAVSVLALLDQEDSDPSIAPAAATSSRRPSARDILRLLPPSAVRRPKAKAKGRAWPNADGRGRIAKGRGLKRTAALLKQGELRASRYNRSGNAITADHIMATTQPAARTKVSKVKGKTQWKKWMPAAIQKAAFANAHVSLKQISNSFATRVGKHGKASREQVRNCRAFAANTIVDGTHRGLKRLQDQSLERPFHFWITQHMMDETKLWYKLKGNGFRQYSTLASHTQVTWKDGDGIHDADVIRAPKALRVYTSATQWSVMSEDGICGIAPREGERPQARFHGVLTISDSHGVNKLTVKYLRQQLPEEVLILPSFCQQHHTGTAATGLATFLRIFTSVWRVSKTFEEGDFP
jgi:hypothetical protein